MPQEKFYKSHLTIHVNSQPMPAYLGKLTITGNHYTIQHTKLKRDPHRPELWMAETTITQGEKHHPKLTKANTITPAEYEGILKDLEVQLALQPLFIN